MDTPQLPPGLSGNWSSLLEGPPDADWLPFKSVKHYTNAYIVRDDKVIDISQIAIFVSFET